MRDVSYTQTDQPSVSSLLQKDFKKEEYGGLPKMNTLAETSVPPSSPQPALTTALTPVLFTASKIRLVIAPGSFTGTEPNLNHQVLFIRV